MMINKRLIAMMGDSKRYIARNVALQWVALLANIAMIFAVSAFLAGLVYGQGSLSAALLVLLGALVVRFFCTRGAASTSYNASRTVKKTLRAAIYEKLLRLGGGGVGVDLPVAAGRKVFAAILDKTDDIRQRVA